MIINLNYSNMILRNNPVAYWELSTDGLCSIGSVYDINLPQNTPFITNNESTVRGSITALDSRQNQVNGSFDVNWNPTNDISIEAWVKFSKGAHSSDFGVILAQRVNGSNFQHTFGADYQGGGAFGLQLSFVDGQTAICSTPMPIDDDKWHHVMGTRQGNIMSIFVDYIKVNSVSCPDVPLDTQPNIDMTFSHLTSGYGFRGLISDVAIYNHAISEDELLARASDLFINGKTLINGIPTQSIVRIYNHETGILYDELLSDILTGEYIFESLPDIKFDVVCHSIDSGISSAISGGISPTGIQ